jgi:hypothetical protein
MLPSFHRSAGTSRPFAPLTSLLSLLMVGATMLLATGCDLEVNAHADVSLDATHTLHVSYRSAAPSSARGPSHP